MRVVGFRTAVILLAVLAWLPSALGDESWSSRELGVRITPPRDWVVLSPGPREAVLSPLVGRGKIALFSLPSAGGESEDVDLDRVADDALASLEDSFKRFKLLGRRPVEVSGRPAREIYFRGQLEGERFRFVQTIVVHRQNQIILMYIAPDDAYNRFLGDYDQTVRSLRWLPQG